MSNSSLPPIRAAQCVRDAIHVHVQRLLAEAGVKPIVTVRAADGSRLRDVEARSVEQAGEVLLYVINPRRERLELRLETQRRFAEVEDLRRLERRAYDGKLEVPARDTMLFLMW